MMLSNTVEWVLYWIFVEYDFIEFDLLFFFFFFLIFSLEK